MVSESNDYYTMVSFDVASSKELGKQWLVYASELGTRNWGRKGVGILILLFVTYQVGLAIYRGKYSK